MAPLPQVCVPQRSHLHCLLALLVHRLVVEGKQQLAAFMSGWPEWLPPHIVNGPSRANSNISNVFGERNRWMQVGIALIVIRVASVGSLRRKSRFFQTSQKPDS